MAKQPQGPAIPQDQEEADVLFKTQMKVANFLLGYWKHGLGFIGVILLVSFIIGTGRNYIRDRQRDFSAQIAQVERDMPQPDQLSFYGLAPADDLHDPERVEQLEEAARGFEAVAEDASGVAEAEAWIKAGDTWGRLGRQDEALAAFQKGYEASGGDVTRFAAGNRLAVILWEREEYDRAEEVLRELGSSTDGYLAEKALLTLMDLHLETGDTEALSKVASEFRVRFAASPRLDQVARREARAGATASTDPSGAEPAPEGTEPPGLGAEPAAPSSEAQADPGSEQG